MHSERREAVVGSRDDGDGVTSADGAQLDPVSRHLLVFKHDFVKNGMGFHDRARANASRRLMLESIPSQDSATRAANSRSEFSHFLGRRQKTRDFDAESLGGEGPPMPWRWSFLEPMHRELK